MPRYRVTFIYDTGRLLPTNGTQSMRFTQHVLGWRERLCPRWRGIDPASIKVEEMA